MTNSQKPNYTFALTVMVVLMFLLGFITTMNNSMIAFCNKAFSPLDDVELQLINTAFYGAYILSIPIAWLLGKIGYKTALVAGVIVIGLGMALNYLGVEAGFYGFLGCMFLVAVGIVLLQVALNPYVLVLGPPETAATRLTVNQTFNSLATFIAPLFVSMIIVSNGTYNVSQIQVPFLGLGIFAIVLGVIVMLLKLPAIKDEEPAGDQVAEDGKSYKSSAFKYPHVMLGALAIFTYLGVEVGIPSFFPAKFESLGLSVTDPTSLLSLYWGGLLVGRAFGHSAQVQRPQGALGRSVAVVALPAVFVADLGLDVALPLYRDRSVPLDHVELHLLAGYGRSGAQHQAGFGDHLHRRDRSGRADAGHGRRAGRVRARSGLVLSVRVLRLHGLVRAEGIENPHGLSPCRSFLRRPSLSVFGGCFGTVLA